MERIGPPYRTEGDTVLIEIRLSRLQQLFESLDPAPFHEKDLDPDAEAYIVGAAREIPLAIPAKIVIQLPPAELAAAGDVGAALHNYFAYRRDIALRDLREQLRLGRTSLIIGLGFLFACISAREIVVSFGDGTFEKILSEGLIIMGWVAMWRPIQVFLYDWWPIRRTVLIHAKLATIPVELRPAE